MSHPSRLSTAAFGLLALCGGAHAGVTAMYMETQSLSRSCIQNCGLYANYETDQASVASDFGTFADQSVSTEVLGSVNSFPAHASSVLTLVGNTGFTLQQSSYRSATGEDGAAEASSRTSVSFLTDATAGTMTIAWGATYERLAPGNWLNAGVSFSAPSDLVGSGGESIPSASYESRAGHVGGVWSFDLRPDTWYTMELATVINQAFHVPGGAPVEVLDVSYHVTLPTITAAVPEPPAAALWLAGLAIGAGLWRRQAERSAA